MRSLYGLYNKGTSSRFTKAILRLALSWTDMYAEPDLPYAKSIKGETNPKVHGFTIYNDEVYPATCTDTKRFIHFGDENGDKNVGIPCRLYSRRIDCLHALRSKMEMQYAKSLLAIDIQINEELLRIDNEKVEDNEVK